MITATDQGKLLIEIDSTPEEFYYFQVGLLSLVSGLLESQRPLTSDERSGASAALTMLMRLMPTELQVVEKIRQDSQR